MTTLDRKHLVSYLVVMQRENRKISRVSQVARLQPPLFMRLKPPFFMRLQPPLFITDIITVPRIIQDYMALVIVVLLLLAFSVWYDHSLWHLYSKLALLQEDGTRMASAGREGGRCYGREWRAG